MKQSEAFALLWYVGIRTAARVQAEAYRAAQETHKALIVQTVAETLAELDAMRGLVN